MLKYFHMEAGEVPSSSSETRPAEKYKAIGEQYAKIEQRVDEVLFGGKTYKQLTEELDRLPAIKSYRYKDVIRNNRDEMAQRFLAGHIYSGQAMVQGIVGAKYSERERAYLAVVTERDSKDGRADVIKFSSPEEIDMALKKFTRVWARDNIDNNVDDNVFIVRNAVRRKLREYNNEYKEDKSIGGKRAIDPLIEKINQEYYNEYTQLVRV